MTNPIATAPVAARIQPQQHTIASPARAPQGTDTDGDNDASKVASKPAQIPAIGAGSLINTHA